MHEFISNPEAIVSKLSFTHLREIMSIDDPLVRYFYEQECMRCTWSVRELRRQIGTNLHIRVGLSKDPEKCLSPYKAGMDNNLFVSTYQLQLPDESVLEKFLLQQMAENQ